jgi:23S rRNA G2445 N2-methylase RlmL
MKTMCCLLRSNSVQARITSILTQRTQQQPHSTRTMAMVQRSHNRTTAAVGMKHPTLDRNHNERMSPNKLNDNHNRRHRRDTAAERRAIRDNYSNNYNNSNNKSLTKSNNSPPINAPKKAAKTTMTRPSLNGTSRHHTGAYYNDDETKRIPKSYKAVTSKGTVSTKTHAASNTKGRWRNVEGSRHQQRNQTKQTFDGTAIGIKNSKESHIHSSSKPSHSRTRESSNHVTTGTSNRSQASSQKHQLKLRNRPQQVPSRTKKTDTPARTYTDSTATTAAASVLSTNRYDYPPYTNTIYVSCHKGLESVLYQELDNLLPNVPYTKKGFGALLSLPISHSNTNSNTNTANTRNSNIATTIQILHTLHLYLGTATNILLQCHTVPFAVRALGELQRKVQEFIPWSQILNHPRQQQQQQQQQHNSTNHPTSATGKSTSVPSQSLPTSTPPPLFQVKVTCSKSRLLHTTAIRDHLLKGIYQSLGYPNYNFTSANKTETTDSGTTTDVIKGTDSKRISQHDNSMDEDNDNDTAGNNNRIHLVVQLHKDQIQISINTNGNGSSPIHQRQYRLQTCKAPLREDIAYAMLYNSGYKPKYTLLTVTEPVTVRSTDTDHSNSDNDASSVDDISTTVSVEEVIKATSTTLLDPFCGSGTIPIEAAAMMVGVPPGRLRDAPMRYTCLYSPRKWEQMVTEVMERTVRNHCNHRNVCQIYASDRDEGAVQATNANAQRAGVLQYIQTDACAFTKHPFFTIQPMNSDGNILLPLICHKSSTVFIVSNLPFGRRISTIKKKSQNYLKHPLLPLYQSLGNHINILQKNEGQGDDAGDGSTKNATNSNRIKVMLLTDDRELVRLGGFQKTLTTQLSTTHGGIPVCGMYM